MRISTLLCIAVLPLLSSCFSLEQVPFTYLQPATVSLPPQIARVAVIDRTGLSNHIPTVDPLDSARLSTLVRLAGLPAATVEVLAQEMANRRYFDEVVVCDSVFRVSLSATALPTPLSPTEVDDLLALLRVDMLVSLEDLSLEVRNRIGFLTEHGIYRATTDVTVRPVVSLYASRRSRPLTTLHPTDSIFWETVGSRPEEAARGLIPHEKLLREASDFAGILVMKELTPYPVTSSRLLYSSQSGLWREAFIHVREGNWSKAGLLWDAIYKQGGKPKAQAMAAYNLAVCHEQAGDAVQALSWLTQAETLIQQAKYPTPEEWIAYKAELNRRCEVQAKLNAQMRRLKP